MTVTSIVLLKTQVKMPSSVQGTIDTRSARNGAFTDVSFHYFLSWPECFVLYLFGQNPGLKAEFRYDIALNGSVSSGGSLGGAQIPPKSKTQGP